MQCVSRYTGASVYCSGPILYHIKVQNINQKFKIQPKEIVELIQKLRQKIKDQRKDGIKHSNKDSITDDWPHSGVSQDCTNTNRISKLFACHSVQCKIRLT